MVLLTKQLTLAVVEEWPSFKAAETTLQYWQQESVLLLPAYGQLLRTHYVSELGMVEKRCWGH
ncbi:hypothetical protein A3A66_02135 [Microgenomates group bacterium RIFCSPLOWO2_01_FULL_46_13]|nr:MAG: hypothetical protein A2783_01905 [Microgenomates group bacterium RIFCSPHIGHO2_01_FULL_45_11]OGV94775.1 MAG: hypothetical protein A3A66_02135 [Microgenomates group bacterium RIFCSPLOWO2_01_FULL_46_13]